MPFDMPVDLVSAGEERELVDCLAVVLFVGAIGIGLAQELDATVFEREGPDDTAEIFGCDGAELHAEHGCIEAILIEGDGFEIGDDLVDLFGRGEGNVNPIADMAMEHNDGLIVMIVMIVMVMMCMLCRHREGNERQQ